MTDVFSAHAGVYDRSRRQLVPCFEAFYGTPARILSALGLAPRRCLDLGAGTGLLSAILSREVDIRDLVLLDQSGAMLERGRGALAAVPSVTPVVSRLQDIGDSVPEGGFDAIWSALAIHHLTGPEKRALFGSVRALLRPGGIFINADQSLGPTPALEAAYRADWLCGVRALGAAADDVEMALERMTEDRMDTLADQMAWLGEAGLSDARVWFQDFSFNVYSALRKA